MRVANSKAKSLVNSRLEFKGSNTFSEWINECYIVFSYGYHFPIYVFKNGRWYANSEKYSVTTSKHQSQLMPSFDLTYLTTSELKKLWQ